MATEYRLRTIQDIFNKVPVDRIEVCMKELTTLIVSSKHLAETMRMVASDITGEDMPNLYEFQDEIVWVDDGQGLITANFPSGGDSSLLMKLELGKE